MNDNALPATLAIALACLCTFYFVIGGRRNRAPAPLPPGPRGLPLLGNLTDYPQTQPWKTFSKWGETYGGIVYVNVLGNRIIVLNDATYAIDMLDKKSRIYSDRPKLMMAGHLVGFEEGPALAPFGRQWGEYRRLMAGFMGTRAKVDAFEDVLSRERDKLARNVAAAPGEWAKHAKIFASGIVLMLTYGYELANEDDSLVHLVNDMMDQFSEITVSNAFFVDVIPALRHVPKWFPGAAWKKKAFHYRQTLQDTLTAPYNWTKEQLQNGRARQSFVASHLEKKPLSSVEEYSLKWAALGIYSGGADTTVAGIECFVLAMTIENNAQRKAQKEIDAVLGSDCLPSLADRGRLPYCEALFAEVLRMYTFGPIGLPHVLTEDDVHDGYFIPKGSVVLANNWQFYKDPKTYKDPGVFKPDRFIATDKHVKETDPREYTFGYGRRACPGVRLADASLWLACVSLLALFDIRAPIRDGKPVAHPVKLVDGTIARPEPFECNIKPRSAAAASLIRGL